MFHRVTEVKPLDDMKLMVRFAEGKTKYYDVKPLLERWQPFQALKTPGLFHCVQVDQGGYGIVWNDDVDLSCEELWENGKDIAV